jgi:hypothetical protein
MTCPHCPPNKIKESLPPLPEKMKDLPIDERGYPVPWFTPWIAGKPEFLMADARKLHLALTQRRCWVCGKALPALGKPVTFVIGPMCMINRITSEPPNHMECAEFSVKGCPFLSKPNMARRENDNTKKFKGSVAGIMIERNPGVTLLYTTRSFKLAPDEKGKKLISLGEPLTCSFWREGRPALPAEVKESVDTGLPLLRQMCFCPDDHKALDEAIAKNQKHFPWT